MPLQGVTDGIGPVVGAPSRDYSDIGKLDFMTLLVAQIKNQDPMSPMNNSEFTSQITQFTMLEEMESMNANLEENRLIEQSINNTSMLALVGKNVTVEGNKTTLSAGVTSGNMVATKAPGTATIEVTDDTGHVVATYEKDVDTGLSDVSWDGMLEDGTPAPDGKYTISVSVSNGGDELPFTTLMTGPVEGLRYENNQAVVNVGGFDFYVSEIYQVS